MSKKLKEYTLKPIDLKKEKIKISYSKINMFKDCPGKYYFRYLTDLDIKQTIWPGNIFGQALHKTVEDAIIMKNDEVNNKIIIKDITNSFEKHFFKEQQYAIEKKLWKKNRYYDEAKILKYGKKLSINTVEFILKYFSEYDIQTEQDYNVNWDYDKDIEINGIIDLELKKEPLIIIGDLKTTKDSNNFYFVDWDNNIQKIIYDYIIYKQYKVLPTLFTYIIINTEDRIIFLKDYFNKDINNLKKYFEILDYYISILKKFTLKPLLEYCTPEEIKCKWCEYNKYCNNKYESLLIKKLRRNKNEKNKKRRL